MTKTEAKSWLDQMTDDQRVQMVMEHRELKQHLCAQTLCIPTGTDDWIIRAIREAAQLRHAQNALRAVIRGTLNILNEAHERTLPTICYNCQGNKTVNGESCCICKGTGAAKHIELRDYL